MGIIEETKEAYQEGWDKALNNQEPTTPLTKVTTICGRIVGGTWWLIILIIAMIWLKLI